MSIHNLDKIFKPASIAVIGASEKEGTIGYSLVKNLLKAGYQGMIFPVNPRYSSIQGLSSYPSVSHVGKPIDLAVVATPIATAPAVVRQCVEAGIGGGIIISAGGKEIGAHGERLEAEIKHEAEQGEFRIIGPNCMGILCTGEHLNASFASTMPLPGKLAFISQSGAICAAILDLSLREGIGFRHFVSIGSMLDVDFGDLINYLGHDPQVGSIVLYIEHLTHTRKFMSAARAVSRVKPIVVLKAGKSRAGALAASSHTGALTGEDAVYDTAFKRAGIVRVETIEELFDCAELMAKQPPPKGPGLGIITNGGGPGVMAADALSTYGLEPALLTPETLEKLDTLLPPFWSRGNPIDILGDATPGRWRQAVEVCLSAPEIKALVIIFVPQSLSYGLTVAQVIVELLEKRPHLPVFAVWMGGKSVERGRQILNDSGIPTYETPERAVSAFMYMYTYSRSLEMLQEIPPKLPKALQFDRSGAERIIKTALEKDTAILTEVESKALLKAYGIPVTDTVVAGSRGEAVALARQMGYPVVMKIYSRQITHKTDAGGIQLNLRSDKDVEEAFSGIMERCRTYDPKAELLGVTVQPMVSTPDYELIMGSKRDPDFGPVILFGLGGIMTEILKDRALALPPLNRLLARRLIQSTRIYGILKGYRNHPPARMELLEELLIRLSQLVSDFSEVSELDINPMILAGDKAWAVDARVLITPSTLPAPLHLVISPYPNQYEMTITTTGGVNIFLRPIKPEDAPLLRELFHALSSRTIYYRFFRPMKEIPPKMLALFTQIDYDRDVALVALDTTQKEEKLLAVARLMSDPGGKKAEFAVLVGDPWQGKGIGAALMERLVGIAGERGLKSLWGLVLAENTHMLALAKRLGFTVSRIPEAGGQYQLNLELTDSQSRGEGSRT